MRPIIFLAAVGAALTCPAASFAASAVQKECSAKYQAAKAGNTLAGLTYNQYYKQCAAEARAAKAGGTTPTATTAPTTTTPSAPAPTTTAAPVAPRAPAAPTTTATRAPSAPPAAAGATVFPTAVSPQYSSLSAGKARFKTCDDQYRINKTSNANGGLKWIQKGGGYYSECNKRLKS